MKEKSTDANIPEKKTHVIFRDACPYAVHVTQMNMRMNAVPRRNRISEILNSRFVASFHSISPSDEKRKSKETGRGREKERKIARKKRVGETESEINIV